MALAHPYCARVAAGEAPIATKFARAKKDPIGTLIAGDVRGRDPVPLVRRDARGRSALSACPIATRALFWTHEDAILERLREPGGDGAALLDRLEVWIEMVRTPRGRRADHRRTAGELWARLSRPRRKPEYRVARPLIAITKKGERAKHQPDPKDRSGLDPHKARVRMIQVYSPEHEAVFLFDLDHLSIETLAELGLFNNRKFVAHNAAFEYMMLRAHEHEIALVDSMQLAGLVLGCEFGSRTLGQRRRPDPRDRAAQRPAALRLGRPVLCRIPQVNYAAADAVVCHRAARQMWRQLSTDERRCFEVQNAAIPAIARMRLTGCPFDSAIHRETIQQWEIEHAEKRAEFKALTGEEPPARDKVGRWLEAHLPPEEIAWMPRTENGTVSARSDLLKHLAHHAEIRPLLRVLWSDKRLRSFGHKLIEAVSPVTGRVHPDFMLGTKAGRLACTGAEFPTAAAGRAGRDRGAAGPAARGRRFQPDRAARARRAVRRRSPARRVRAAAVTCTGPLRQRSPVSRSRRSLTPSARPARRSCSAPTTAPAPRVCAPRRGPTSTSI